jgi:hypothetical protein
MILTLPRQRSHFLNVPVVLAIQNNDVARYHRRMPSRPIDPTSLPWKRKPPAGRSQPLSPQQIDAARLRAGEAGRRYPNLVDNMWAARNVGRAEHFEGG